MADTYKNDVSVISFRELAVNMWQWKIMQKQFTCVTISEEKFN